MAGTSTFSGIRYIFTNLQSTNKEEVGRGQEWTVAQGPGLSSQECSGVLSRGVSGWSRVEGNCSRVSAPFPSPQLHTQLMSTYFGRAAWESLTLQKPYITFWFSKWPESSCKPPSGGIRRVSGLLSPNPYPTKGLEPKGKTPLVNLEVPSSALV